MIVETFQILKWEEGKEKMRRNFAQVLKDAKININEEYDTLYRLFYLSYGEIGLREKINNNFEKIHFRGTCITLDDFDNKYGFDFETYQAGIDEEYLVSFCEYIYNLILGSQAAGIDIFRYDLTRLIMEQIQKVIEEIGYMETNQDDFIIFVEKNSAAISVAEILPQELSYKVISYNHHSMKGDVNGKKEILLQLATKLEAKREVLKKANKVLESDLFFLFNNINIRHNNCDKNGTKYKAFVADMSKEEIEKWYDNTYQMCLIAFLEIEHLERKDEIDKLKQNMVG